MEVRNVLDSYWSRLLGGSVFLLSVLLFLLLRAFVTKNYGEGVLVGTGVAVIWYTVETYYLRREMARQNEISTQPIVAIMYDESQASREELRYTLRQKASTPYPD